MISLSADHPVSSASRDADFGQALDNQNMLAALGLGTRQKFNNPADWPPEQRLDTYNLEREALNQTQPSPLRPPVAADIQQFVKWKRHSGQLPENIYDLKEQEMVVKSATLKMGVVERLPLSDQQKADSWLTLVSALKKQPGQRNADEKAMMALPETQKYLDWKLGLQESLDEVVDIFEKSHIFSNEEENGPSLIGKIFDTAFSNTGAYFTIAGSGGFTR
jgi:hypothetical protein